MLEIVCMVTQAVGVMARCLVMVCVKVCVRTGMGDVFWRCRVCPWS